jgi:adenylosuccinate synthase
MGSMDTLSSTPTPDAATGRDGLPAWLAEAEHAAVCGLQWGDEGKGKIVDWLAAHFDVVARYNGGANAGHSVVADGKRYALHLVPCGILHEGSLNVIGNGCVVDADTLLGEIATLEEGGVDVAARLRLSDRAHLVLPHHKRADALFEAAAARSAGDERRIGTTGRGIGPAYADKAVRSTAIRVADLAHGPTLEAKVRHAAAVANATLSGLAAYADAPWESVDAAELLAHCERWRDALAPYVTDAGRVLREARDQGKRLLFEGANATLLDVDHGTYPFVTSSATTALGIHSGAGVPAAAMAKGEIVGVVKAYATRVGAGPFPTELEDATSERLRERGNEYGTTTGRPRRCGWLDLVAVRYAAQLVGATRLSVMLLDVLAGFDTLKINVAYRHHGRELDTLPAHAATVAELEPVYIELPGFAAEIDGCRDQADLPKEASAYLRTIEEFVGLPVSIASVGPDRAQTIHR